MTTVTDPHRLGIPREEEGALKDSGEARQVAAGELLFQAGEPGGSMYLIEEGAVELRFQDGRPAKVLEAGAVFGELALLWPDHRRTASALVRHAGRVRRFDQHSFQELMESAPRTLVSLLRRSCRHLLSSEQTLIKDLRRRNEELERTIDYLRRAKEDLAKTQRRSRVDPLTGLYNRRFLEAQSPRFLRRAAAGGSGYALLLLDVDRFKEINDSHGHGAGNRALQRLARRLRDALRWIDLPFRIGGDEFAVLLAGISEAEPRRRLRELFEAVGCFRVPTAGGEAKVTVSLGAAPYREGDGWEELFERADRNLYLSKRQGGHHLSWDGELIA